MMTTGHIPGEVPGQGGGGTQPGAADGAQNAPGTPAAAGAPSEQEVDYLQNADPEDDASSQAPEDPRRREARLKRRRRLLTIGGVPAALVTIISLWLGSIFLISLAGNRAAAAGHYDTALSRYRTVARINPWLEQWRVHFNLGTGQLAAKDPTSAVTTLNQALREAPKANLYVAHLTLAAQAQESGSSAAVTEHIEAAKKAADTCEVPPPPEQNPSPSPNPSARPSSDPSSNPSSQPSSDPSSAPSATPSSDPSSSASSQPSSDPSSSPSSSSSPGETSSSTPSAKPTPTPVDDRAKRLRDRNNGSPGTTEESGGGEGGGKPW